MRLNFGCPTEPASVQGIRVTVRKSTSLLTLDEAADSGATCCREKEPFTFRQRNSPTQRQDASCFSRMRCFVGERPARLLKNKNLRRPLLLSYKSPLSLRQSLVLPVYQLSGESVARGVERRRYTEAAQNLESFPTTRVPTRAPMNGEGVVRGVERRRYRGTAQNLEPFPTTRVPTSVPMNGGGVVRGVERCPLIATDENPEPPLTICEF